MNLIAFEIRLSSICLQARLSADERREAGDDIGDQRERRPLLGGMTHDVAGRATRAPTSNGSFTSLNLPASIFDISRMSLTTLRRCSPLSWMRRA